MARDNNNRILRNCKRKTRLMSKNKKNPTEGELYRDKSTKVTYRVVEIVKRYGGTRNGRSSVVKLESVTPVAYSLLKTTLGNKLVPIKDLPHLDKVEYSIEFFNRLLKMNKDNQGLEEC